MQFTTPQCKPQRRCRNLNTCHQCRTIRQTKIAARAEQLFSSAQQLTFSVITPHERGCAALKQIKSSYLDRCALDVGLWTIERAAITSRLHINLISSGYAPHEFQGAKVWHEPVTTSARIVAAYISKPEFQPTTEDYAGHTYGTIGQLTHLLAHRHQPAHIQLAAAELIIDRTNKVEPHSATPRTTPPQPTYTRDEYRAIAARHLPGIHAILTAVRQAKRTNS